jgi:23S rRNA (adenine2503-C2)-methyltransferase
MVDPASLATLIDGEPSYRVDQLRDWLYRTPVLAAENATSLPAYMRTRLAPHWWPFQVERDLVGDGGKTRKWLFRCHDGAAVEAVLMGYRRRTTLCISSQAGCALACTFCATGQFGFERHLEAGEIVAQVAYAQAFLRTGAMPTSPDRVTNVVFMGMGEPLANYRRVRESIRRMVENMGLSPRSLTVSTVGIVPGMLRLAEEPWRVNLAVSLHAADDELRSRLVPINKRYPLAEVEAAAANYFAATGRRISIEWTLMDGVNDGIDQAEKLIPIARRLRAHVNVIALNPTPLTSERPSSTAHIRAFVDKLVLAGITATVRDTRGRDIDAACGQLRLQATGPKSGQPAVDGAAQVDT